MQQLDNYKTYMDKAIEQLDFSCFNRKYKSRYHTFKYALEHLDTKQNPVIIELGTTRSFVNGNIAGCMQPYSHLWNENMPENWDHGAGCFTFIFGQSLQGRDFQLHSVDINPNAISISKHMTANMNNIFHHTSTTEEFLNNFNLKADIIYMDAGDCDENGALLHFRESNIISKRNILKDDGLLIIDDVRNSAPILLYNDTSLYGKGKYSIPYLLTNGFEIVMDEYQMILRKQTTP